MENVHLASSTVQRLTLYQKYLQQLPKQIRAVTPDLISDALAIDPKVIRQDMKSLLSKDRVNEEDREVFEKAIMRNSVYRKIDVVVLAGVGKLGKALMSYAGFAAYDLDIMVGFDVDPKTIRKGASGKPVYHINRLNEICRSMRAKIGVIATPGDYAQLVCDAMVKAGVTAIWNFTSVRLITPSHVMVHNEDLSFSLRRLADHASTN